MVRTQEADDGDRTKVGVVDVYARLSGEGPTITLRPELEAALIAGTSDLDPPLRLMRRDDASGTWSGLIIPMLDPEGKHGFNAPDPSQAFDLGAYLLNQISRYLATSGRELSWDACQATWTCDWISQPQD